MSRSPSEQDRLPTLDGVSAYPLRASIVRILDADRNGVGLGLLVGPREVVTCAHVVARALGLAERFPEASASLPDAPVLLEFPLLAKDRILTARVEIWQPIAEDESGDVAGLRLYGALPEGAHPTPLARSAGVIGHGFVAYGSSARDTVGIGTWVVGEIRGVVRHGWLQLAPDATADAPRVEPGFSGTPLWDRHRGQVVGLVRAVRRHRGVAVEGFALPADTVLTAWPLLADRVRAACPFRMLTPFDESDAGNFHGRERLIDRTVAAIVAGRVCIVSGASGAGKTSLLHAGILPSLRRRDGYLPVVVRPAARSDPWLALASAMERLVAPQREPAEALEAEGRVAALLRDAPPEDYVHGLLDRLQYRCLVLIIDQFEELSAADPTTARRFLAMLVRLAEVGASQRPPDVRLVIASRTDVLADLTGTSPDGDSSAAGEGLTRVATTVIDVTPMDTEELHRVVTEPVRAAGTVRYEPALAERIIADLRDQPYCLPVLQATLTYLWERQTADGLLTHEAYQQSQQGAGPIAQHLDEVWSRDLGPQEREQTRRLALHLALPLEDGGHARRIAHRDELDRTQWELAQVLATTRMLVLRVAVDGNETVEFTHDALMAQWPRLAGWLTESRELLRWRSDVRHRVLAWAGGADDQPALLEGSELRRAEALMNANHGDLSVPEREFVMASSRLRRTARVVTAAVLTVVLVLLSGVVASTGLWWWRDRTSKQQAAVAAAHGLLERASFAQGGRTGALVAADAFTRADTPRTRQALAEAYRSYRYVRSVSPSARSWRSGHEMLTTSANQEAQLAYDGGKGGVEVWRLDTLTAGHPPRAVVLPTTARAAAISGDGRTVATLTDNVMTLWDATNGKPVARRPLARPVADLFTDRPVRLALDHTGTSLGYVVGDIAGVIDTATGADRGERSRLPVKPQFRHGASLRLGPDGRLGVVTYDDKNSIRHGLFRPSRGPVVPMAAGTQVVGSLPDRPELVLCRPRNGLGGAAQRVDYLLLNLETGRERPLLADVPRSADRGHCAYAAVDLARGFTALLENGPFEEDGQRSRLLDEAVEIWDHRARRQVASFPAPSSYFDGPDSLLRLQATPDGSGVLTVDGPGGIAVLELPAVDSVDFALAAARAAAYDPTDTFVVVQGQDGSLSAWDRGTGRRRAVSTERVTPGWTTGWQLHNSLAFNRDGTLVATPATAPGSLAVWETRTMRRLATIAVPQCAARTALSGHLPSLDWAYSAATLVVTCNATTSVWDARTGAPRGGPFRIADSYVLAVPHPTRPVLFVLTGPDNFIETWSLATGRREGGWQPLPEDRGRSVYGLALHPDGSRLAITYSDGPLLLQSTDGGREAQRFEANGTNPHWLAMPGRIALSTGAGLVVQRTEPATVMDRLRGNGAAQVVLPVAGTAVQLSPKGGELLVSYENAGWGRVSTDPLSWHEQVCRAHGGATEVDREELDSVGAGSPC
ncbi:trypsin-like peptidase domain-containing protein [Micromonospora sp. DT178]|uniref:nSTAND1 domain-containing NTPase n=1 Tax=Micromonospora sp. DT178 TaxID=3393436 RepID=UPI003CFA78A1